MTAPRNPVSVKRLRELAHAVTLGPDGHHEFTMRVPAEPDRDADLVLSSAADEIDRLRARVATLEGVLKWCQAELESGKDAHTTSHTVHRRIAQLALWAKSDAQGSRS